MASAAFLAWMVAIFILSTDSFSSARTAPLVAQFISNAVPALSAVNPVAIELLTRKLAHWTEYFILAVLFMRTLNVSAERPAKNQVAWGLLLGVIFAVVDEFHQSLVPSRTASTRDVLINAIGFFCGILSFYAYLAFNGAKPVHARDADASDLKTVKECCRGFNLYRGAPGGRRPAATAMRYQKDKRRV